MALKGLLPGPGVQVVDRDLGLVRVEEERLGRDLEGVAPDLDTTRQVAQAPESTPSQHTVS